MKALESVGSDPSQGKRWSRRIATGAIVAIALMWVALTTAIDTTKSREMEAEFTVGQETVQVVAGQMQELFDLSEDVLRPAVTDLTNPAALLKRLDRLGPLREALSDIFLVAPDGEVSAIDLRYQNNAFKAAAPDLLLSDHNSTSTGTVIERSTQAWASEESVFAMTRRVQFPNGQTGLIGVSLRSEWVGRRFKQFRLGNPGDSSIGSLIHLQEGVILTRVSPEGLITSGHDVSSVPSFLRIRGNLRGRYIGPSSIDGVVRVSAFERVQRWPVSILWARSLNDVLAEWQTFRNILLALGAVASLILLIGSAQVIRLLGRLQTSERRALVADQAKTEFLSSITHELRTPLTGIRGFAELIERHAKSTPWSEPARRIRRNAERLNALLDSILDLTRLEYEAMPIRYSAEPLPELVAEVFELYDAAAAIKGLAITLDLDDSVPDHLPCDGMRLRQILGNLLANAIKFTAQGSVQLRVQLTGPTLRFDVIDSGPGIAEEFLDQIFERFRQAAPVGTQRYGGTGLGLALARSLAQAMQGSLIVQSQLGTGSQFTLRLPMRPAGIDLENLPRTPIRKVTPTSVSMPP